ncbi:MAG: hypothetical protein U5L09_12970 [Bacteroidales bacterium]|nr:hypothetical protein [Bacteroidales bacterium]
MQCYLHIGPEKTGSTTIQSFFAHNRENLKRNGYFYPKSIGWTSHRDLSFAAYNRTRRDDYTQLNGMKTDDEIIKKQKQIFSKFNKEINSLPSDLILICSNEHIQSRLTTIEELENLKYLFKGLGVSDIKIVLYLRNPPEIANSLFSTALKYGSISPLVPPPTNKYYNNVCNHKATIKRFGSVFGYNNMLIRLFRKDKFVNGSLLEDMVHLIGMNNNMSDFVMPKKQNESLSLLGIEFIRRINIKMHNTDFVKAQNYRNKIIPVLQQYFSSPKYSMPKEQYEQYDTYFAESNEWVRSNFFPEEKRLFHSDYPPESKLELPEREIENIVNFIQDMVEKKNL